MEPVTTAAAVSTVVGYLAKKIKDNKSIQSFLDDFTEATVNWIRPIFLEDDKPKEVLRDLEAKPESTNRQEAMKNKIAIALEDNPSAEKLKSAWLCERRCHHSKKACLKPSLHRCRST